MVNWLLPSAPADKLIPKEQQHSAFIKYRTRILVSTILAYASYYIVKSNFTLSSPYLTKDVGLTTADIGLVLSALAISYGIGSVVGKTSWNAGFGIVAVSSIICIIFFVFLLKKYHNTL
ncbi:hypothetical protein [Limosilactobacillus sp. c10Ua_36]|uniref:hypothetical protein n=1 Tax=Limosilactobacillus sp. c10Ua_36 TaxID=2775910 RepID=UPI002DD6B3C1|nr:hypothetical protein [Limosilactobacillus sp. c10Ua_36]